MKGKDYFIRLYFAEEVLGSASADPNIHRTYIASKAADAASIEEEIDALGVDAVADGKMTVFPKLEDGTPFLWDYQMRGAIKGSMGFLRRDSGSYSSKIKAYKKAVDGDIMVYPRKIPFQFDGGRMGVCERPLRAQTMQGDRVALASSETVPEGATCELTIRLNNPEAHEDVLFEALDFGMQNGIGQWRNSGKGRYDYELIDAYEVEDALRTPTRHSGPVRMRKQLQADGAVSVTEVRDE